MRVELDFRVHIETAQHLNKSELSRSLCEAFGPAEPVRSFLDKKSRLPVIYLAQEGLLTLETALRRAMNCML